MKVLMISADSSVAQLDSEARGRMREYAGLVDELHVVVANVAGEARGCGQEHHEGALHVYPTCSRSRIARTWDAYRRTSSIINDRGWTAARDVLVTTQDSFELGLVGVLLRAKFKFKLQVQCHVDFLSPFFANERLINRVRVLLARFVLRRADAIRVVSERIAASVVAGGIAPREKISVLPMWVDVEAVRAAATHDLHAQFPEFKKIILMASRLTNEKQTLWACRALQDLCTREQLGIVVLGDGPERVALTALPQVRTLGWVNDIAPYLKGADIFVNVSLYEGYGRTLVQAAASGTPTVTTDVGVARELFERQAIVPVGDAAELQAAAEKMLATAVTPAKPSIASRDEFLQLMRTTWKRALGVLW